MKEEFDVCVIGSGAAGGVMARALCEAGAKVVMLEAGKEVPLREFRSHLWPYDLPYRGLRSENDPPLYASGVSKSVRYEDSDGVGVDRIRCLGGRTLHWNAVTLRYASRDFRERSLNGSEEDWPLAYEDLAHYYDRIEEMIGVCGNDDGLDILPSGKQYLPPLPWRCSEHILHRATQRMNIPLISVRKAVATRAYNNRPPCHYCGHCMNGCDVGAIFTTPNGMLPQASATGNFTLRQNALAREILVDREGLARGVLYINTETKQEEKVTTGIVAVCCGTVESARLLLNSRSPQHPNGLANSSGVVGRYLHGHLGSGADIYLDELTGVPPFNQDGATDHVYIPRYNHLFGKKDYIGGWGIQVNFSGYMFPHQSRYLRGYGAEYKSRVRAMQTGYLMFGTFGKIEAHPDNHVRVDPNQVDEYGIPIPVIHFRFSENDIALWRDSNQSIMEICSNLKGQAFPGFGRAPGGFASHEVGTVRMGKDPRTSALNGYCQAHDVKNLFVSDGGCFTTSSEKNPTLTIMALSLRAADYIQRKRKLGEL